MTTSQTTLMTQNDVITKDYASAEVPQGQGQAFENAVLDNIDTMASLSSSSISQSSLSLELPSDHTIREWISYCPSQFSRDMAYGLLASAVRAYDSGDLDSLGQAVVDWASTLELEADRKVVRRMRRRVRGKSHVPSISFSGSTYI